MPLDKHACPVVRFARDLKNLFVLDYCCLVIIFMIGLIHKPEPESLNFIVKIVFVLYRQYCKVFK